MEIGEVVERVVGLITEDQYHKDYNRTVELSKDYHKIITTEGLKEDLKVTKPVTETQEMFELRCEITHFTTKSVSSNIKRVFYEVGKSDNLQKKVSFDDDKDEEKKQLLEERLKVFAGNKSASSYLGIDLVDLVFEDPNAFVVVAFDKFDPNTQKAEPYPTIYYSKEVQDYQFNNNILQYLLIKKSVTRLTQDGTAKDVERYMLFGKDFNVFIEELPDESAPNTSDNAIKKDNQDMIISFNARGNVYELEYKQHDTGFVTAFRSGYETDPLTKHRTCLGPLDPAMPYFMKSIKVGSELDITITKHAHPKEYRYVSSGRGNKSIADIAKDINDPDGSAPKSALEVSELPLPPGTLSEQDLADLSKLAYTHHIPVEFVKWLSEYVEGLEAKCKKAVFNSDTFERDSTVKTATEKTLERYAVNATLQPFGNKFSESFKFIAKSVAEQMDLGSKELSIVHIFNGDFKTVTLEELIDQYKLLHEADAPSEIKDKVSDEIVEKQFKDDPYGLRKINVKADHNPMRGKSKEEIMFLLASNLVTPESKALYANLEEIFSQIEMEDADFYYQDAKKRKAKIDEKVKAILEATKTNSAFSFDSMTEDEPEGTEQTA